MGHFGSRLDSVTDAGTPDYVRKMFVDGNVLIVCGHGHIDTWDITDPASLSRLDTIVVHDDIQLDAQIDKVNDLLYISESFHHYLWVYDYSDPSDIVQRDVINPGGSAGSLGGQPAFLGNYCYIPGLKIDGYWTSIGICNITDVDNLVMEAVFTDGTNLFYPKCCAIDISETYLFVAGNTKFSVFTISGATLVHSNTIAITNAPQDWRQIALTADGKYAYVTNYTEDCIEIIDVTDPTNVSDVGTLTDATYLNAVREIQIVDDKFLYGFNFSGTTFYMTVWDISSPTSPTRLESLDLSTDKPWVAGTTPGRIGGFAVDDNKNLYVGRYTTLDGNGVASYAIDVNKFPADELARVTSIRHIYQPGKYFMEIGLGSTVLNSGLRPENIMATSLSPATEPVATPIDWQAIMEAMRDLPLPGGTTIPSYSSTIEQIIADMAKLGIAPVDTNIPEPESTYVPPPLPGMGPWIP